MKRLVTFLIIAALCLVPALAAAQAPAKAPEKAPAATPAPPPPATPAPAAAPQAAPAPEHPKPGPGMACPMQGQMTPEQMKQMHDKCCAMMQQGKGCPMHEQMQKQVDELSKRVEALEGKKKGKKK